MHDDELLGHLRDEVLRGLLGVVEPGTPVALVDFPNYANVGDTAIWLGEEAALRAIGCPIVYRASFSSYNAELAEQRMGRDGVLLLQGGGNFGDVWETFQLFRERVVRSHPTRKVVQLPQTIHFTSAEGRARAVEAMGSHRSLTIFTRDATSQATARDMFPLADVRLAPDFAFALRLPAVPRPRVPLVILARTDGERVDDQGRPDELSADVQDWPAERRVMRARWWASRYTGWFLKRAGPAVGALEAPTERLFAGMASERMRRGLEVITRGEVLITDRLHGHILALLAGRPHVLLDNSYGKNRHFHEQWTSSSVLTAWASSMDEAVELAGSMRPATT